MILPAQEIRRLRPVEPFAERTPINGLTGGLSAAGYDVRIARAVLLWPGRFALSSTVERFAMPDDVLGVVHDKSTLARLGVAVQNTVIEPGWRGYLTLEITMHAFRFLRLRAGTPIAQIIFHRLKKATAQPYDGKYQDQKAGPQRARRDSPFFAKGADGAG